MACILTKLKTGHLLAVFVVVSLPLGAIGAEQPGEVRFDSTLPLDVYEWVPPKAFQPDWLPPPLPKREEKRPLDPFEAHDSKARAESMKQFTEFFYAQWSIRKGERKPLGHTPTADSRGVVIPRDAVWGVSPSRQLPPQDHPKLFAEVREKSIPGLLLSRENSAMIGLEGLKGCLGLKVLHVAEATDEDLSVIGTMTGLVDLDVSGSRSGITDAGISHLGKLTKLRRLDLSNCHEVTDRGLSSIRGLTELKVLELEYTQITDAGLAYLKDMGELSVLDLGMCRNIIDEELGHLAGLKKLRWLILNSSIPITDKGLERLSLLSGLVWLDLTSNSEITGNGVRTLGKLTSLRRLELNGCFGIKAADVKALRTLLPETSIEFSGDVL